jgi:transitional endoplasmic reticulum ATPase
MTPRVSVELVPLGDAEAFRDALVEAADGTLGALLRQVPALSLKPLDGLLDEPLRRLRVTLVAVDGRTPLFRPPVPLALPSGAPAGQPAPAPAPSAPAPLPVRTESPRPATIESGTHPDALSEDDAVRLAYGDEIERIASFVATGLSVLVRCDKLVVRYLWPRICRTARVQPLVLDVSSQENDTGQVPRSLRQRQLSRLRTLLHDVKAGQVLVLPHLDVLAGGVERLLTNEAGELTELLYEWPDRPILAFADRNLLVPEVIAARFAVRPELAGLPRDVPVDATRRGPLGVALVTRNEAAMFRDFRPPELFKNVAGLNPVRLRHAIAYAVERARADGHSPSSPASVRDLYESIRAFKVQTSAQFEVPDVRMEDIGGYEDAKAVIERALGLMAGIGDLPDERLRRELIPRGFLFYGPPGTGKTLFAKAIAHRLSATIRVVSGPEVTDMYVGESERKVREIFAEARRNAPSVIVFDEFDSIAARRTGRDDGGSRAGNALVAQILTEMDGFRPDVPMLVVGTTNRLEIIDEALLRPSRFQPVGIQLPDRATRRQIAAIHARHFRVPADEALLEAVAGVTDGFNGDMVRSLFRDACVGLYCETPPRPVTVDGLAALAERLGQRQEGAS